MKQKNDTDSKIKNKTYSKTFTITQLKQVILFQIFHQNYLFFQCQY
jgi:hypothetical protein